MRIICRPLAATAASLAALLLVSCNHGRPCFQLDNTTMEVYGPTDVNAATGNMGLSVGVNRKGTITVFKWPNPSYYDQIKFMTQSRDLPLLGALPNEGAMAGIYWETEYDTGFAWLRGDDFDSEQFYNSDDSDCVVTSFVSSELGLAIRQFDLVLPESDVMVRHYLISRETNSVVSSLKLIHFANFHPVVTKYERAPLRAWCLDCLGDSSIAYHPEQDAIVYFEKGRDASTGIKTSVAIAIGTRSPSDGHQAGIDSFVSSMRPRPRDPFIEAAEGRMSGNNKARGEVAAGFIQNVHFDQRGRWEDGLIIAAAADRDGAVDLLEEARGMSFRNQLKQKREFWGRYLANAPMPDTGHPRIIQVAKRSLISILQGTADTGAIVASIDTQGPYGEDWPRDGAFINVALEIANLGGLVEKHNLFYARVQSRKGQKIPLVPEGNWASVYYADGVHGMPIPYEIDETGFALWTLWDHYERNRDLDYLEEVYPAIEAGADFLVKHRDPKTGLHRKSYEDDDPRKRQTIHGAAPIHAGLRAAAKAAETLGHHESAGRWTERADEIRQASVEYLLDPECNCFGPGRGPNWDDAWVIYPGELYPYQHPIMQAGADSLWKKLSASMAPNLDRDLSHYEPKALLSLAIIWKDEKQKIKRVQGALLWQASVPITGTGHFGEAWSIKDGEVTTHQDMPHIWHHALFYAAAVQAFGPKTAAIDPNDYYDKIAAAGGDQ